MFVKSSNGQDVVKFWAYDYYENRIGGVISFRYQTGFGANDIITGDLNYDGNVNINDVIIIIDIILNYDLNNNNDFSDLNNDNFVDILDVLILINIILMN